MQNTEANNPESHDAETRIPATVMITGGSRGLGKAIALEYARLGANIALTYRDDHQSAEQTSGELKDMGADCLSRAVNVSDEKATREFIATTEQTLGPIDVLINNAALFQLLPLPLIDEQEWDTLMNTNVKGCFITAKSVLQRMIRRKTGSILNIGSIAGQRCLHSPVHYATSKAALNGMTYALAQEVGHYNIRVNLLALGLIDSNIGNTLPETRKQEYIEHNALGRITTLEEAARSVIHITSAQNTFQNGSVITLDGGL